MKINGVDFHYYRSYAELFSPQYDWEHLILTAGASEGDLNLAIPIAERTPDQIKAIQRFIHEYIHFLQNFSTTWGGGIFSDLFLAYSKISVSKETGKEKFVPPLNNQKIKNDLFDDGVVMRNNALGRLVKSDDDKYDLKNELQDMSHYYLEEKVVFSNGISDYAVGAKAIREHMANIGSFLVLGYSDDDIHNENATCGEFIDDNQRLFRSPEYWMLFEYFKSKYANLKNVGKGIFFLCNECLTRANPDKAFYRFFEFFTSDPDRYLLNKNFIDFVESWKNSSVEQTSFSKSFDLTVEHVEKQLSYVKRNSQHHLPVAALNIIEMILENLRRTDGGRALFSYTLDFSDLLFWDDLISKFGSSLVSFNQDVKIIGSKEYCLKMENSFTALNSASLAFKEVNKNSRNFTCPFLIDIPICRSNFKDEKICDASPYEMLKTQSPDACCNLVAGIYLLGLEERLILD